MLFDMENPQGFDPYSVLTALVVPRPIAWVSTLSSEGIPNLAPFSFFNAVCDEPPVVMLSISKREDGRRKDTAQNILCTGDFVVNVVCEELLEKLKLTAEDFPPEVSEFKEAGLTPVRAYRVKSPRVGEAKAWLECRLLQHQELFGYDLFFGRVVLAGVEHSELSLLRPVGRTGGGFCRLVEIGQEGQTPPD